MNNKQLFFTLFFFLFLSLDLNAGTINIIVHADNAIQEIDRATVKRIYLGRLTSFSKGNKAVPLDGLFNTSVYDAFYQKIIGKSSAQLDSYWSRRLFAGKGQPPSQIKDKNEIIEFVSNNINSIAYVSGSVKSNKVKVIMRVEY